MRAQAINIVHSMMAMMIPSESWVARWQRTSMLSSYHLLSFLSLLITYHHYSILSPPDIFFFPLPLFSLFPTHYCHLPYYLLYHTLITCSPYPMVPHYLMLFIVSHVALCFHASSHPLPPSFSSSSIPFYHLTNPVPHILVQNPSHIASPPPPTSHHHFPLVPSHLSLVSPSSEYTNYLTAKFTPGMYAIAVHGNLPSDYIQDLASAGYKYHPRHP